MKHVGSNSKTDTLFYYFDEDWPYVEIVWVDLDSEFEYRVELEQGWLFASRNSVWGGASDYECLNMPLNWDFSWIAKCQPSG